MHGQTMVAGPQRQVYVSTPPAIISKASAGIFSTENFITEASAVGDSRQNALLKPNEWE